MVGVVDTAIMGRQPEPAYVGAVALGATVFATFYWMLGFLRMGTTGLVAQRFGADDAHGIVATLVRAFMLAVVLGAGLVLLQRPILLLALGIIDGSETVEAFVADYFSVRIWGAPAFLVHVVELGLLFGLQRMRVVLALTVVFNTVNIVLDVVFVLVLGMGVEGVALGTVISEWVACGLGLWFVRDAVHSLGTRLRLARGLFDAPALATLFGINANLFVRTFFVQLPFLLVAVLGAKLGDVALAANAVLMQYFMVMTFGLDGFAHAAETLTGYAVGARDRASMRNTVVYTSIWAFALAVSMSLAVVVLREPLIALMTSLPEVRETAYLYTGWLAALPLAAVWAFQFDGIYIGATATRALRNNMFVASVLYLAVLLPTFEPLQNHALWLSMLVFMFSRGVLLALRYPALERQVGEPGVIRARYSE